MQEAKRRKQAKIWIEKNFASIVADVRAEKIRRLMAESQGNSGNSAEEKKWSEDLSRCG